MFTPSYYKIGLSLSLSTLPSLCPLSIRSLVLPLHSCHLDADLHFFP